MHNDYSSDTDHRLKLHPMKPTYLRILRGVTLSIGLAGALVLAHADAKDDIKADMVAGRWSQAESKLADVLKKHPDNALAHYWNAQVLEKQGKDDAAKAELTKAIALEPNEEFVGNKAQLAKLEKRLGMTNGTPAATVAANDKPAVTLRDADAAPAAVPVPLPEPAPVRKSGMSGATLIFIAAGVLLVGLIFLNRRKGSDDLKQQRDGWAAELNDCLKDLADAQVVSDSSGKFSEEARLGNYDRLKLIRSDLNSHLASLPSRTDFQETQNLALRARDVAAEIRGEERPSDRLRREQQDREAAQAQAQANMQMQQGQYGNPMMGGGMGGGGGGLLRDAALLGGGALLGSMLSGSAGAHERHLDGGSGGGFGGGSGSLREVDDDDSGIDVGGSDAGSDMDFGGGGDDNFN